MGRTPLTLSHAAETALRAAMVSAKPLVVRSRLSEADALVLVDEWELHVAQDATVYQMADGQGKQLLAAMWASPMRLEHDLQDTATPNPVVAWLRASPPDSVGDRVWQLQQRIEVVAAAHGPVLRRPVFATGLIAVGGGSAHFDDYNNAALVLAGNKSFFIAPPNAMTWEDGPRNGKRNERLDVNPLIPGPYTEPPLAQWRLANCVMCYTYREVGGTMLCPSRTVSCRMCGLLWLSSPSSARAAVAVSASMLESIGTRSMELCDRSMLATNATVAQLACRTKYVHRPGRMKACVTTRTSPFPTARLHARHFARELGASPSEYVFGRVLKEESIRTASASLTPGTAWYSIMVAEVSPSSLPLPQ